MIIYDDIYTFEGFGGRLKLGSGNCRLRIFNLEKSENDDLKLLKPYIVVVEDQPGNSISVKSAAGHIATKVVREFNIDPNRMVWIEHYPEKIYGVDDSQSIPERFERIEFQWHDDKAIKPLPRPLKEPLLGTVKSLLNESV